MRKNGPDAQPSARLATPFLMEREKMSGQAMIDVCAQQVSHPQPGLRVSSKARLVLRKWATCNSAVTPRLRFLRFIGP